MWQSRLRLLAVYPMLLTVNLPPGSSWLFLQTVPLVLLRTCESVFDLVVPEVRKPPRFCLVRSAVVAIAFVMILLMTLLRDTLLLLVLVLKSPFTLLRMSIDLVVSVVGVEVAMVMVLSVILAVTLFLALIQLLTLCTRLLVLTKLF